MATTTTLNIRTTTDVKRLIQQAAEIVGSNKSEFAIQAAQEKAREVLLDRVHFALSDEQMERFNNICDQPLPASSRKSVERLLSRKAPWES
ncbi:DUF1778 domain-containing protein [Spongiibacter sp. KMU-158]|uniref:DUF1778 domain-containing protein n=1 Tax=Spongiibacter pelagi TaxID=2760804 RepID=A0A927GW91_9GAMM|nr:DUF1778 domain-containing protein [Spongiibacter pelagi]MBD2858888.1 DUF1778 domain-containing protein [Spongiibacter pelagi]